jgi:hypothetical protein
MSKSEHDAVIRGREAWDRVKKHADLSWEDWMMTGVALTIGREECLAATHANDINSKRYRNAFSGWLTENGFGDMDKAARSRLFECMEHQGQIEAWRARLTLTERLKLNHPDTVLRRWRNSTVEGKASSGEKPETPAQKQAREVARLQEELDAANAKLRRAERDQGHILLIDRRDTAEQILAVLESEVPTKAARIAALLLNRQKGTAPRSAPKVKRGAVL